MPTLQKENVIKELETKIGAANATIYSDYRGLTVSDVTGLRKKLREVDAEFHIVKNTLFKRAAEGKLPLGDLDTHLAGPTAVTFAQGDAVNAAKALLDYAKDHKELVVKAGVVDGKIFSADQVTAFSKLPPKEVIIAEILGALDAPAAGFVSVLDSVIADLVFTIQSIAEAKTA